MAYTKHLWTTNKETSAKFNAATANEMEQGIFDAHLMAVPVDCTSRVAEYTGDGGGATVKDRAGNGNNLTATNITYVNGKYGKEMSFNGSTSYAQASSPVIGTTGTVAIRFKRGNTGLSGLFGNSSAASNGILSYFFPNNVLAFSFSNGTTRTTHTTKTYSNTTDYNTVIINSNGQVFIDGSLSAFSIPTTWIVGLDSLYIGRDVIFGGYFNGIISHFRYDSRIWTADEVRAWYLNPISIDSRVA